MKSYTTVIRAGIYLSLGILGSCKKGLEPNPVISIENNVQNNQPMQPGFASNNMVMYWNDKVATVMGLHTNPGSDSRAFAMIEIAVHDALNSIKPKYQCFALLNEKKSFANPDAAVASASYWAIKGLNVQKTFPIDSWYAESLSTIPDGEGKTLGIALGKKSAEAILANRATDGLSQVLFQSPFPLDGDDPGEYRVTLPFSNPDLGLSHSKNLPNWGIVMQPFVLQNNYQFRPPGPYPVNSSEYTTDFNEVKAKGARLGSTRTTVEDQLAWFWADTRHHSIWNLFTRKIIATKNMDAWKTARLFAMVHTAMADGMSSMFEAKYHFYYWRPETAIRIGDDGNPNTVSDPSWLPSILLVPQANPLMNTYTPRVPEYPSSFAICGGIMGKVLESFFESDEISIEMTSATLPGVTLPYTNISKAVSDNSISKIFAGWYFRKAIVDGEEMGKQIGDYVFTHHFN